jgi:hypothetical protein
MHIVVPEDQVDSYWAIAKAGIDLMPCPAEGISATRAWILENSLTEKSYMVDDDMNFCHRVPDWDLDTNAKLMTPSARPVEEVGQAFDMFEEWLDHYVCVSMSARQGNQVAKDRWFRLATRMNNMYGFNVPEVKKLGIEFGRLKVMEDFDVTLQMLTMGIPNKVSTDWAWNQRGSGKVGGCSDYRTVEVQAEAAHKLKALFPDFVKIVEKDVKATHLQGIWSKRTDVVIQWRKAYDFGLNRL